LSIVAKPIQFIGLVEFRPNETPKISRHRQAGMNDTMGRAPGKMLFSQQENLMTSTSDTIEFTVEEVSPSVAYTDSISFTGGSGGSRTTFDTGRAVKKASEEVIRQMRVRAALLWDVANNEVKFLDGNFICTNNEEDRASFKEMAGRLMETGGLLTCSASDRQGGVGAQLAGNNG
jgi:CO/xanthine dehydrogenase Mo-binding subunit